MFQSRYRDLVSSVGKEIAYAIKYRRIYFNPVSGIQLLTLESNNPTGVELSYQVPTYFTC
jgi:hypothetical protein